MILRFLHHFVPVFIWFSFFSFRHARADLVNRTIDDTAGDSVTGAIPIYLPTTAGIWEDATCAGCRVKADRSLAYKGTWTSATFRPEVGPISIEMGFKGTAIYVFFILANNVAPFITTETACNFTLDGTNVGSFEHMPSTSSEFQYNASVYTGVNLLNTDHKLVISSSGLDRHVFMSFDYAIYTVDEPTTSSATNTPSSTATTMPGTMTMPGTSGNKVSVGAIAGGIAGGVTVLLAFLVALCLFCRRRQRRHVVVTSENRPVMKSPPSGTSSAYRSNESSVPFTIDGVPHHDRPESRDRNVQPQAIMSFSGEIILSPPRMRQENAGPTPPGIHAYALTPSRLDPGSREELRRARQAEIDRQLRELVREMRELNKDRKLDSGVPGNAAGHHSPAQTRREELEIVEMREQMQAMREHIEYLQAQQNSEWAQGLSDEPPPGYSARLPTDDG